MTSLALVHDSTRQAGIGEAPVATRWEVERAVIASDMNSPQRLIMLVLLSLCDADTGEVPEKFSPSLTSLTVKTGLGRSTVARDLGLLEAAGWVARARPSVEDARSKKARTGYRLAVGAVVPKRPDASPSGGLVPQGDQPASPSQGLELVPHRDQPRSGLVPEGDPTKPSTSRPTTKPTTSAPSTPTPPAKKTTKPKTTTTRGTRIPDDFTVTAEMIAWARTDTPLVGAKETDAFVDYWRGASGQRGVKADWIATWRNWMRKAQSDAERRNPQRPANGAGIPPSRNKQILDAAMRRAEEAEARGGGSP